MKELGQGAFGIVYEASLSEPRRPEITVAIKSLRRNALDSERDELLEEALVVSFLSMLYKRGCLLITLADGTA